MTLRSFLLIPLIALCLSAEPVSAQTSGVACPEKGPPQVQVRMTSKQVNYDFTLSQSQLVNFDIDTQSPYDQGSHVEIGGLMNGEISVNTNVSFGWAAQKRSGETCYWYDTITVTLHIEPTIYVAKEHPQGSCMHNSILAHEMKHIDVDRDIIKKYSGQIENDIRNVSAKVGVIGPVSRQSAEKTREKMMAIIEKTVSNRAEKMYTERRATQQAIDSLQEYERVTNSCKR